MTSSGPEPRSDRENAGLRGPVHSVIEERTYPASTDAEGKIWPAIEQWNKTEYDRDGRMTARWFRTHSPEQRTDGLAVTRYNYTPAGKLLSRTFESDGKVGSEITYDYDDRGRLKSITNSSDPTNPIAFHYDPGGRKTKIAIRKPAESPQGTTAVSSSFEHLFDDEGSTYTNSSEGGSTQTLYDESNRPVEMQFHDPNGTLTSRAIRIYDGQGRISEEKMLVADPVAMFQANRQSPTIEAVDAQQLREAFSAFLGGPEMWSVKYGYDDKGRKSLAVHNTFNHIHETTAMTYNEQGDIEKEVTHHEASGTGNPEADESRSGETVYTYEYDPRGNWISKKTTSRDLPDGPLKDVGDEVKRTIEYY